MCGVCGGWGCRRAQVLTLKKQLICVQIPVDGDLVTGAPTPATNSNGRSNKSKRKSFIKITNDEIGEADYFQDIETNKTVWEIPADGDLVNM